MFWFLLIAGIVSLVFVFIASITLGAELHKRIDGIVARKIPALPEGISLAGAAVFVCATLNGGLPYSTDPLKPETVGVLIAGAGAVIGLLIALIVGWAFRRKDRDREGCFDNKRAVWGRCALLYTVAAVLSAVPVCVDWLAV